MKYAIERRPLFPLGKLVATPGALAALQKAGQSPAEFLSLHVRGQWGDISDEDRRENEYSLQHGFRLLSSYRTKASTASRDRSDTRDRNVCRTRTNTSVAPTDEDGAWLRRSDQCHNSDAQTAQHRLLPIAP